jgi:Protein of unknown function (DUF1822)
MNPTIETEILRQIYPEHVLIDLSSAQVRSNLPSQGQDLSLSQIDLNRLCMTVVKSWMSKTIELEINPVFPCWFGGKDRLNFISKLVNGFAVQIGETKIIFIPSDSIDLEEFTVPQEWVDLPNWAANYYVPVRVDLHEQHLHLWGFISHADLKNKAQFDRVFRNYQIAGIDTIANLDLLQEYCELHTLPKSIEIDTEIDSVGQLSTTGEKLIQQLQQHNSRFSPRLELPFSQWGAMLNHPQWLERYLNPETDLSLWWKSTKLAICDGWESIENFINPPQAIPALNPFKKIPTLNRVNGVALSSDREIQAAIAELYHHQTDLPIPDLITNEQDLIPLLKYCKTAKIWWKAAEYLWTIKPNHSSLITRIRQLETQFAGHSIALMISMILTPDGHIAVLVRLYPTGGATHLPPGLQLTIQNDQGANLLTNPQGDPYIATARKDIKDVCIQLYFVADADDRFGSCIKLDNIEVTKAFKLQKSDSH